MKGAPENDVAELRKKIEELEEKLLLMLLPKDPNSGKDVIMEIRAGTGGEEAALFAADLFRMYSRYADIKGMEDRIPERKRHRASAGTRKSSFPSGAPRPMTT